MKYNFEGKNYTTLASCYQDNQDRIAVGIATVRNRLQSGWSLEQALLQPKQKTLTTKLGEHTVEGEVFENLPSIAKEYGIPLNTIYKRYSRGCRGNDLIPLKKRKTYSEPKEEIKYSFIANGTGYKSAADACKNLGVKYVTYRKRIEKGFTIEQALNIHPVEDGRVTRGNKFNVDGTPRTIEELSEHFKISEMTIRDRLQRGATIRQAIGLDEIPKGTLLKQRDILKKKRNPIQLEVYGETFTSYKALADKYGLPQYVVRQRIVDYGYTPEAAVKPDGKSKPIKVEGIEYPSKAALAQAYGLTPAVLMGRLADGSTVEQALRLEVKENSRTVTYEGEIFRSLKELADKKGISAGALRSRLNSGLSLKEAIDAGDKIRNSGRYNLTILERDNELANKPGSLYFVRIIIENKILFKVGITTQTVKDRLKQESYEFETLKVIEGLLIDCFKLEQELINLMFDKRAIEVTSDMLDGYSEIFNLNENDVQAIIEILGGYC